MFQTEQFEPITRNGRVSYADQLAAVDDVLYNYAVNPDPNPQDIKDAQIAWDAYEANNPVMISTDALNNYPITNLEALPFRTLLENLNMPFADDIVYTAADITASTDIDELLANTLANVYQMGTLSQAVFIAVDYLRKPSQTDLDAFSDPTQNFIKDAVKSTEPFEMIAFPQAQLFEATSLIDLIATQQDASLASIVLHPMVHNTTIILINASNIDGMSTKQVSARLTTLSKIKQAINITKVNDIVASPEVDRNLENSHDMSRGDDEMTRGERVRAAKVIKLESTKRIVALIKKDMRGRKTPQRTENVTKTIKKTYNKPNRREPDNDFKPGKTKRNIYRPNIHLYLDTSGSMSLDQYKTGITAAIQIAKELKTNIYLSSFSDSLAEPILLDKIKSQSTAVLLKRALAVPVLSGGTDFENVYNAIDARATHALKKRHAPEYTIILSDMEYWFSSGYMVPKQAQNTLHLMVSAYDDDAAADFKTSAYNAGVVHIDRLLYEI